MLPLKLRPEAFRGRGLGAKHMLWNNEDVSCLNAGSALHLGRTLREPMLVFAVLYLVGVKPERVGLRPRWWNCSWRRAGQNQGAGVGYTLSNGAQGQ